MRASSCAVEPREVAVGADQVDRTKIADLLPASRNGTPQERREAAEHRAGSGSWRPGGPRFGLLHWCNFIGCKDAFAENDAGP